MNSSFLNYRYIVYGLFIAVLLELLSVSQFFIPPISNVIGIFLILLFFGIAYHHYYNAILLLFIELSLSGHGYMLQVTVGQNQYAMRHVWFVTIIFFFFVHYRRNIIQVYMRYSRYTTVVLGLALLVIFSQALGYVSGNTLNDIYFDSNAYIFLLLLFPLLALPSDYVEKSIGVIVGAVVILSLKTLIVLFIFSHDFSIVPSLYVWIRDLRVGEITYIGFNFHRVFLQSQVFLFPILLILLARTAERYIRNIRFSRFERYTLLSVSVLLLSALMVSFSRSFILGVMVGLIALLLILIMQKDLRPVHVLKISTVSFLVGITSCLVVFSLLDDPLSAELQLNRFLFTGDPAIDSRWELLKPLEENLTHSPIFGSGFGTRITYISKDPRIIAETGGPFETFAFEWGWLDIWLKLGFIGLLLFFLYIFRIIKFGVHLNNAAFDPYTVIVVPIALFITVVHFFTPYLNHPLGLLLLFLATLLIKRGSSLQFQDDHVKSGLSAEVFSLRVVRIGSRLFHLKYPL